MNIDLLAFALPPYPLQADGEAFGGHEICDEVADLGELTVENSANPLVKATFPLFPSCRPGQGLLRSVGIRGQPQKRASGSTLTVSKGLTPSGNLG